ncbi:MAG TPA: hypothetical protein VGD49_14930 [Longimicrobiales bacterium]
MDELLRVVFVFGLGALIVRAVSDAYTRAVATRAALDIELRIIEKLASADAIANYLATADQRPLTAALSTRAQADRGLQAIQIAIVAFAVGVGVLAVYVNIPSSDANEGVLYFGVLMIALAVGFAAVAVVTRKLLVEWTKPSSLPSI